MGIDKTCTQHTGVKLGMGHCVQLLPLPDLDHAPRSIHRHNRAWNDLASIDEVVCCYVTQCGHTLSVLFCYRVGFFGTIILFSLVAGIIANTFIIVIIVAFARRQQLLAEEHRIGEYAYA